MPKQTFADLILIYQANIFPQMLEKLSQELGVSDKSLRQIGVGFYPGKQAWVFPERDNKGELIGLMYRYPDGKKFMAKNSHRGLTYAINPDYKTGEKYVPGKHNWQRVSKESPCPICKRPDWCLVSFGNSDNPRAVLCGRISEGSAKKLENCGYLHIFKQEMGVAYDLQTILSASKLPILIVEGASDTLAAMDLGFTAVGRPSAEGRIDLLPDLVRGKEVIVVGDNDAGAGRKGMESVFQTLKPICKSIIKVPPPENIKDLRQWKQKYNLTQKDFLNWVEEKGDKAGSNNLLPSEVAYDIAELFLDGHKKLNESLILRNYKGQWVQYADGSYSNYNVNSLRGELYQFLKGKHFPKTDMKGATVVSPFKPTRAKVSDIVDAFNAGCPVDKDPPLWLKGDDKPDPKDLIIFKNGILNINEYVEGGEVKLYPLTPDLFTFNKLPYNYDPKAESELFSNFCKDIFSNNKDKILLLSEWLGYNLVPDMSMEKFMLFIGRPRSGKSTMLEVLTYLLGQNQCCSTSFQSLCGAFGYQPLIGKLAALLGDAKVPHAREADAALEKILQITGGDPVTINRKGIQQLPFVNLICRFTVSTNDLPAFTDHSRALEPRMNILHFGNSYIGKEDRTLKQRLKKEAQEGKIINFALRGLKMLREQRIFIVPKSSEKILKSFVELTTPLTTFITECCLMVKNGPRIDHTKFTTKNELYEVWQKWCLEQGRKPGMKEQFGRWLLSACPRLKTDRMMIKGRRYYIYRGLKLQDWIYEEYLGRP